MSVCVCKVRNFVIYEIIFICLATNSNFLFNIEFTIWFSSSIFQSFVLGLPLLLLSGSNPVSRYVVQIILVLVFAICISVVGFIFLPKMLRPLLATGPEHRHSSVRAKFGASYVSSTSGGASRYNSQESRGSDPDVGVAKAARWTHKSRWNHSTRNLLRCLGKMIKVMNYWSIPRGRSKGETFLS